MFELVADHWCLKYIAPDLLHAPEVNKKLIAISRASLALVQLYQLFELDFLFATPESPVGDGGQQAQGQFHFSSRVWVCDVAKETKTDDQLFNQQVSNISVKI